VYDDHGPAEHWPLTGAYLIGPEGLTTPGKISLRSGHIVCKTRSTHTVALCVQHDAGPMGRLMLQTCLLMNRQRPYQLSIELARHRIMMFIAKSAQESLRAAWVTWGQKRWKGSVRVFEDYGTRNLAEVLSLGDAIDFQQKLGATRGLYASG